MASTDTAPSSWEVGDMEACARRVKLSDETVATLVGNQVDRPTLVTLQKEELRSELGILSLPARRYLWEPSDFSVAIGIHEIEIEALSQSTAETPDESAGGRPLDAAVIEQLRSDAAQQRQVLEDHICALHLQGACHLGQQTYEDAGVARSEQRRIEELAIQFDLDRNHAVSLAPRGIRIPYEVLSLFGLSIDACVKNRANVSDEALQGGKIKSTNRGRGQEERGDKTDALESLPTASRCNHAVSLAPHGIRIPYEVLSLFGLSIDACVKNRANVSDEALQGGKIKSINRGRGQEEKEDKTDALESLPTVSRCNHAVSLAPRGIRIPYEVLSLFGLSIDACFKNRANVSDEALQGGKIKFINRDREQDEKEDKTDALESLPTVSRCNVCYIERISGFSLAYNHAYCVDCMKSLFKSALKDTSLLPLRCCELPIDMNASGMLLEKEETNLLQSRLEEMQASSKMYCPTCSRFINLDFVDSSESTELPCTCGALLCTSCKAAAHNGLSCRENQAAIAGSDDLLLEVTRTAGWKQCPACEIMIELEHGCNHMICANCNHGFCFRCLRPWQGKVCSSGRCEVLNEDMLLTAGEARVQAHEAAQRLEMPAPARRDRLVREMNALRANEDCQHNWVSKNLQRECESCGFDLWAYGMVLCVILAHTLSLVVVDKF